MGSLVKPIRFTDFNNPGLYISPDDWFFIDTSFLIALAEPADRFHDKASSFWPRIENNMLVINNVVISEYVHVYMRTLYTQDRRTEIFYKTRSIEAAKIADKQIDDEWGHILRNDPKKSYPYFCQVRKTIEPLIRSRTLQIYGETTESILEAFNLKSLHHLGSSDAILLASAKDLGAIFLTTDLRMVRKPISNVIIYATTP